MSKVTAMGCTIDGIAAAFAAINQNLFKAAYNAMTLSDFRKDGNFGENYGVMIKDSALRGLLTRSIFVIDKEGKIAYVELVPEITNEPNYAAAIEAAKKCL